MFAPDRIAHPAPAAATDATPVKPPRHFLLAVSPWSLNELRRVIAVVDQGAALSSGDLITTWELHGFAGGRKGRVTIWWDSAFAARGAALDVPRGRVALARPGALSSLWGQYVERKGPDEVIRSFLVSGELEVAL